MRKITAIPSKKIAFKNVPVSGLFFLKRTLYQKDSVQSAKVYSENKKVVFQQDEIVRFIVKAHEYIAIECIEEKKDNKNNKQEFKINDTVEIIEKSLLGKVVSINNDTCLVQYKDNDVVSFNEFKKSAIRKIKI